MSEWHITPDYIVNNWTDELLTLMIEKLVERKNPEPRESRPERDGMVSDHLLFQKASNLIEVKKSGD